MMLQASGVDKVLQEKEFSRWSSSHGKQVSRWEEYLVFGALFGIADKVAKQLKDINPELFTQVVNCDMDTFVLLLLRSNMLSNAILNTSVNYAASQAGQGLGGHSSFGGGGGFSGGGFGGGSR